MEEDDLNEKPSILITPPEILNNCWQFTLNHWNYFLHKKSVILLFRSFWGMFNIKTIVSYTIISKDFRNNMRKKSFETIHGNINIFYFFINKNKKIYKAKEMNSLGYQEIKNKWTQLHIVIRVTRIYILSLLLSVNQVILAVHGDVASLKMVYFFYCVNLKK